MLLLLAQILEQTLAQVVTARTWHALTNPHLLVFYVTQELIGGLLALESLATRLERLL